MQTRTTHLVDEMQSLDTSIAKLGGAAEEQLGRALDALQSRDAALAEQVIAGDAALDALEAEIDRQVAGLFVRRQLMATDLRVTLSSLKISSAMERVGDLAKNTARRSLVLTEHPPLKQVAPIVRFGRETLDLFTMSLESYSQRDAAMAAEAWRQDERLDHLHNGLLREVTAAMEETPDRISLLAQLMFISKNMERIGDHATFIAEITYYIVTGESLGDDRPKGPPDGSVAAVK